MACDVFKIVNNIAPRFIQNLIMLKCIPYERVTMQLSLGYTRLNMDLNNLSMMGPGSGTACQLKCEKQLTTASFAD